MENTSMMSGFSSSGNEIEKRLAHVILGTMAAEAKIEEERLKLSEDNEFYPEIAFNFLKTFTERLNSVTKYSSFFDFTSPGDVMEYNQLDSYKSGFIAYPQLLSMLQYYDIKCTDKVIECLVKNIDPVSYSRGLSYEAFLKLLLPQSVPAARLKVLKRKVIYEKGSVLLAQQNANAQGVAPTKGTVPSSSIIQSLVLIFDIETNLITFTEKAKVKLQHSLQQTSLVQLFEMVDINKRGFIDFTAIQEFVRRMKSKMVPNQYLGLLRRLNKPDTVETISFQDFKDLLAPNLPYFSADNEYQLDSAQHYHEISKDMDLSRTLNLSRFNNNNNYNSSNIRASTNNLNQTQQNTMSQLQASQAIPIAARGQYENVQDKVFFKDRQGRIIEKNHPHEPVFLPENPSVSELLKQNINIVHHPNSDQIYTIIPEQYLEAQPLAPKKIMPVYPFSMQSGAQNYQQGQVRTFTVQNNYELPKIDPKDLTGVDPFWQRPPKGQRQDLFVAQNQAAAAISGAPSGTTVNVSGAPPSTGLPPQPAIDINSITDPNIKKYIEYQEGLIKKYQQEKQTQATYQASAQLQQKQQPYVSQPPVALPGAPPRPIKEQFEEMYKASPYIQDLVQMRHANTASFEPLAQNSAPQGIMRNTNILQSQYNAKSNPYNHNQPMPNGQPVSLQTVGQPQVINNAVIVESMQFPINQIQNSTILNPMMSKTKQKSSTKKKIFEEEQQFPLKLNDKTYQFNNLRPLYQ